VNEGYLQLNDCEWSSTDDDGSQLVMMSS
jgi:hypothetical protein